MFEHFVFVLIKYRHLNTDFQHLYTYIFHFVYAGLGQHTTMYVVYHIMYITYTSMLYVSDRTM